MSLFRKLSYWRLLIVIGFVLTIATSCKKEEYKEEIIYDIDDNIYTTVSIGTQVWMLQNLKTTHYNDGTPIPEVTAEYKWADLSTEAYCNYSNSPRNVITLGRLYNWHTINTGKLAPIGWHVPSDDEWSTLITYLGGDSIAGDKLKDGTSWTIGPGPRPTNETGFTAQPGGYRDVNGEFIGLGEISMWWSSTENDTATALWRSMYYMYQGVSRGSRDKNHGFYIRCVRD